MKIKIIFFLIFSGFLISCQKVKIEPQNEPQKLESEIQIVIFESYSNRYIWDIASNYFANNFQCKLNFLYKNDLLQITDFQETDLQSADLYIGLNNISFHEFPDSLLLPLNQINRIFIDQKYIFDTDIFILPYCYNYLAFLYDKKLEPEFPNTFGSLQDDEWNKKIILMDPEYSSIGKGFLLWTLALFNFNGYERFWRSIRPNIAQITDNYEDAINKFCAEESPITLGFPTEKFKNGDEDRFSYFIPEEGFFIFIDGISINKKTKKLQLASNFLKYVLSEEFQNIIAQNNTMFPVHKIVEKENQFHSVKKPDIDSWRTFKKISVKNDMEYWLKRWKRIMKR